VQLFALFHDARRANEGTDPSHGLRGAELAAQWRGKMFPHLPEERFQLLYTACAMHSEGLMDADLTVQTCWDADRLDLGRIGIRPDPQRLCTLFARRPDIAKWAYNRAVFEVIPDFVRTRWGIDTKGWTKAK